MFWQRDGISSTTASLFRLPHASTYLSVAILQLTDMTWIGGHNSKQQKQREHSWCDLSSHSLNFEKGYEAHRIQNDQTASLQPQWPKPDVGTKRAFEPFQPVIHRRTQLILIIPIYYHRCWIDPRPARSGPLSDNIHNTGY